MNNQPTPSDHEVLTGLVERVTYQNAENGFCVVRIKARGHRELITLVGHAAAISAGEWITASGNWINDRTHGQQFRARFLKTSAPEADAFVQAAYDFGWVEREKFDWPKWKDTGEAKQLRDDSVALAKATPEQLAKLLTVCIRQDRFAEGTLQAAFETGLLTRILQRAKAILTDI